MARMRTIQQTIEYLKAQDPDTGVTEFWLRKLLHSGAVPYHVVGKKKFLVNLDSLEAYLENPPDAEEPDITIGKIRKIIVRG